MKFLIFMLLVSSVFADEIVPKTDYTAGSKIIADEISDSFKNVSGFLKDDDDNPTVCMKLKLKPGLHQFLYVPVDCETGFDLGISQDGQSVYQIGTGGTMLSCLDYYNNHMGQRSINGKYLIDADGVGGTFSPHVVYCDMENGGYTLAVRIQGGTAAHTNANSISIEALADQSYGKLSDAEINQIVTSSYKLICGSGNVYRDTSCTFYSDSDQGGPTCFVDSDTNIRGMADVGVPDNTYYGYGATLTGCRDGNTEGWGNDGKLWIK